MRHGRILILEADKRLRLSRAGALSRAGYAVTGAATADEAAAAAEGTPFDLLIVSVEQPEAVGRLLNQLPAGMSTLMIATEDVIARVAENAGTGLHSFLIPPFSPRKLRERVAQVTGEAGQFREDVRSEVLDSLEHASCPLTSQTETDRFVKHVVETAAGETGADYASLSVRDEASGIPVTRAQFGNCRPGWERVCREVADKGGAVHLDEATPDHPHLRDLIARAGISAMLSVPLAIKGEAAGELNLIKTAENARFTSGDLKFASVLSRWTGMALENVGLLDGAHRQYLQTQRLLQEISVAQENERRRMAAELHDGVAQWMVGASYSIKACSALASELKLDDLQPQLVETRESVQRSVKELRRVIADLRPLPLEELGLVAAVRQTAEALTEAGIRSHTEVDGNLPKLSPAEETTTYRIVQEILTNVRRHSGATEVIVRLGYWDSMFTVEVSDNGRGFVLEEVMKNQARTVHMGLIGMKERAELLGGYLTVDSGKGKGTTVRFAFPVAAPKTVKAVATPHD